MDDKMLEVLDNLYHCLLSAFQFFDARMRDHEKSCDYDFFDSFYRDFTCSLFTLFTDTYIHDIDLHNRLLELSERGQISFLVDNLPTGSKIQKRGE